VGGLAFKPPGLTMVYYRYRNHERRKMCESPIQYSNKQ
jgi:hypothetical protein